MAILSSFIADVVLNPALITATLVMLALAATFVALAIGPRDTVQKKQPKKIAPVQPRATSRLRPHDLPAGLLEKQMKARACTLEDEPRSPASMVLQFKKPPPA